MESTMAEISTLMSQFADKIAEQHHDIDTIHQHAKETNSNVTEVHWLARFRPLCVWVLTHLRTANSPSPPSLALSFQSNRILEQTKSIGRGYGFMIFCFYAGFSILLHALHYFSD